ncbi:hypothetical protein [Nonomuraea sp. B1E8]|uniref:hypothetical protein n=1 Tax=unclassified Nonomuraea TaxID=2593643 RepID=UPI00325D5E6B
MGVAGRPANRLYDLDDTNRNEYPVSTAMAEPYMTIIAFPSIGNAQHNQGKRWIKLAIVQLFEKFPRGIFLVISSGFCTQSILPYSFQLIHMSMQLYMETPKEALAQNLNAMQDSRQNSSRNRRNRISSGGDLLGAGSDHRDRITRLARELKA